MDEPIARSRRIPEERGAALERVAEELTGMVFDDLGPVLTRYRARLARQLGVSPVELTVLDQLRRAGPQPSGLLGDRTGLTRSSVSKMLTRLERAGHVERYPDPRYQQVVTTRLSAHEARDAELAAWRRRVRMAMLTAAHDFELDRHETRVVALGVLRTVLDCLEDAATDEIHRMWLEGVVRRAADRRR